MNKKTEFIAIMFQPFLNRGKLISTILLIGRLLIFYCSISSISAQSAQQIFQIKITGTLIDSLTSSPISTASVVLINNSDKKVIKGSISGNDGKFYLICNGYGKYLLSIQHIGYRIFQKEIEIKTDVNFDVGKIVLATTTVSIREVTVKPLILQTTTEIIYNIDRDPEFQTASLLKILEKVPLVQMNPDGTFFIDSPEKTFKLVYNGRQDALFDGNLMYILNKLPAKGFTQVRLNLAPGQRYGTDYVLNMVSDSTKRITGAVGSIQSMYFYEGNNLNTEPGTTFSSGKLRGNASAGYTVSDAPGKKLISRQLFNADQSLLKQTESSVYSSQRESAGIAISYDLARKHFMTAKINWNNSETKSEKEKTKEVQHGGNTGSASVTKFNSEGISHSIDFSVNYEYEFKKKGRIFNLVSRFKIAPISTTQYIVPGDISNVLLSLNKNSLNNSESRIQAFYIDQINPKLNIEIFTGWLGRSYYSESNYFTSNESNVWISNLYNYRLLEKKYDVFDGNIRINNTVSDKLTLLFDLKFDYLNDGKGAHIVTGVESKHISETNMMVTSRISAIYMIKNIRWNGGYSMLQSRPSIDFLNPYNEDPDGPFIKTGNPELKPQLTHLLNISRPFKVNKNYISVGSNVSFSNNTIMPFVFLNEKGQNVRTYSNYGKYFNLGISGRKNWRNSKNTFTQSIQSNLNYSFNRSLQSQKTESIVFSAMGNTGFYFKNGLNISLNEYFNYLHSKGYMYGKIPLFSCRASATKMFFKNSVITGFTIENLFWNKTETRNFVNTPEFSLNQRTLKVRYPVFFSVSYNFGKFKVKPVRSTKKSAELNDLLTR